MKTKIRDLFTEAGQHLRAEFEEIKKSNPHFAERGAEAEIILSVFLNNHLPKRFKAESGLVIDYSDQISNQIDIIIFDALNSPIYRKGPRISILPIDNVACVIEVKSNLNKKQLEDAAGKIASVKCLKKSPITSADQPVTFSKLINTNTLGVVFAYESETSLNSLAKNLMEINEKYSSNLWIDLVVVLDKGFNGYGIQYPFDKRIPGWFGGQASDNFVIPPFYIHLLSVDSGNLTLNNFFLRLMAHLTFFRKLSTIDFESVMGSKKGLSMALGAYQYNLDRKLVHLDDFHKNGDFVPFSFPYNIYSKNDKSYKGQITWIPWQNGSILSYSGIINPKEIFALISSAFTEKFHFMRGSPEENIFITSVLAISKEKFVKILSSIKSNYFFEYQAPNDDTWPWLKYQKPK